jgi:hypothetical protein
MPAGSGAVCNGSVGVIPPQEESTMKLSIAHIALAPALLLLALPAAAAPQSHGIHVRAFIDGRSQLVLDGSMARWEHFDFAAPGRLECNLGAEIQPTYIDGEAWYPEWPDRVDCENRDCGCSSSLFTRMHQPVPDAEIFPVFEVIQGRGSSALVELPVAANGYRIVIEFNDNAMGGADWYEVCLTLPDCGVQRYCSATPNSTGEAAYLEIAGSLSIQMNETVLTAMNCPPSTMGIFFCGENKSQLPFANGMLCISPAGHGLYSMDPPVLVSRAGQAVKPLDFSVLPVIGRSADHETWSFQFWFRDPSAGGAGANLSNALRVTFCP